MDQYVTKHIHVRRLRTAPVPNNGTASDSTNHLVVAMGTMIIVLESWHVPEYGVATSSPSPPH
jgi:hypothetical protein